MNRPHVVAFDVIETLFSLETLKPRFTDTGLPGHRLETWFARLLRDAFALDMSGVYKPFREVASATLASMLGQEPGGDVREKIDHVIGGFAELDAHADVTPAMSALRDAGIRIATLTNGSAEVTSALLERAGARHFVDKVISIDEIEHWKPHPAPYLHCARTLEVEPDRLALVAAHPWDIQGAQRCGLITGYVARDGKNFVSVMEAPDVQGTTLAEVVAKLIDADRT